MTIAQAYDLSDWLLTVMQLSILVPMGVVWWRKAQFSPPVKRLSWYVYISVFFVVTTRLSAFYLHNNLYFITGFNVSKMLLFAAVYRLVLTERWMRQALAVGTVIAISTVLASFAMGAAQAVTVSRVMQCALLAAFALAYIEQRLHQVDSRKLRNDPMWLLGLGQLIYSATTVSAFSIDIVFNFYLPLLNAISSLCCSVAALVFNYFLTLAFLRAAPDIPAPTAAAIAETRLAVP
ncbi:hypothetical protein GCM10028822_30110 [Hymenobacter terrigena]